MKILVISQYYYPEPFRITDICEELTRLGNEVLVVTGVPNYPMGEIYDGYKHGKKRDEVVENVKIHRCLTIGRKNGIVHRFLNYYSFAFSSRKYINSLDGQYDVVFVNQLSPVIMARAGIKYKQKYNKKMILYCLDLWPESLTVGGIKRGSLIYKIYHRVSEAIYRQADKILITSKSFSDYFQTEFGIDNTEYLPQYSENIFNPEHCKKTPDDYVDLMFAGNLGVAQSVDTILKAAKMTCDIKNLRWHIIGDGSEYENLKKQSTSLQNIFFYGRKPLCEMPKYYSKADAMLVTLQKDPVISLTLPGKVQTYMAAGKPIIGAIDGETAIIINDADCGICGDAEDADQLANNVRKFVDYKDITVMGRNARKYYEDNFERSLFMNKLGKNLGDGGN